MGMASAGALASRVWCCQRHTPRRLVADSRAKVSRVGTPAHAPSAPRVFGRRRSAHDVEHTTTDGPATVSLCDNHHVPWSPAQPWVVVHGLGGGHRERLRGRCPRARGLRLPDDNTLTARRWYEHLPYLRRGGWRKPYGRSPVSTAPRVGRVDAGHAGRDPCVSGVADHGLPPAARTTPDSPPAGRSGDRRERRAHPDFPARRCPGDGRHVWPRPHPPRPEPGDPSGGGTARLTVGGTSPMRCTYIPHQGVQSERASAEQTREGLAHRPCPWARLHIITP